MAIFGQNQSRSSYYFIQFLAVLHAFAKPADFKFQREKVDRTVDGVTSIEGQLVNSRAPDIVIYLRTYFCAALPFIAVALVL